jgi:predicted acylesterase/phospholipase RssA
MSSTRKIGLALSGGGFRATLFHLGVIRFLYEVGSLPSVETITAVSGGSVLAAHLALNWKRYTGSSDEFDQVSKELIQFTKADVRGRIVRRWIFSWLGILPRLLGIRSRRWHLTNLLRSAYSDLYKKATLGSLPVVPDVHLLSTSMTTGALCSFDRRGASFNLNTNKRRIDTTTIDVAYAVAASSAFPP